MSESQAYIPDATPEEVAGSDAMLDWMERSQNFLGAAHINKELISTLPGIHEFDGELNASLGYLSIGLDAPNLGDDSTRSMHGWIANYHPNDPATLGRVVVTPRLIVEYQGTNDTSSNYQPVDDKFAYAEPHNHTRHISSMVQQGEFFDEIIVFKPHDPEDERSGQAFLHKVQYSEDGTGFLYNDGTKVDYFMAHTRVRNDGSGHFIPADAWHQPYVQKDITTVTDVIKSPALVEGPYVLLNEPGGPFISPRLPAETVEKQELRIRWLGEAIVRPVLRTRVENIIDRLPRAEQERIYNIANGDETGLAPHMREVEKQRQIDYANAQKDIDRKIQELNTASVQSRAYGKAEIASTEAQKAHAAALRGKIAIAAAFSHISDSAAFGNVYNGFVDHPSNDPNFSYTPH